MSNNLDDFDAPPNYEDAAPVEETTAPSQGSRISETLKTNPAFKIFLLLIAGGALASAALGVFSSEKERENPSIIGAASDVTSTPGGQASPAFQQAVVEASQQRVAGAVETGGSALPTPLGGQTQITTLEPSAAAPSDDPLAEFRAEAAAPSQPAAETNNPPPLPSSGPTFGNYQVPQQAGVDQGTTQAMQQQMQTLMGAWTPSAIRTISVPNDKQPTLANANSQNNTDPYYNNGNMPNQKMLVSAGTINYGQMLMEANSDVPGPVLAQIVSGPFAGGRAIGSFQVQQDLLVIQFTLVSLDGVDYPVNILALDPDTTLGGMATETDQRYWTRVILPAAADFISGFANSFAQADQSVTIQDGVVVSSRAGSSFRRGLGEGMTRTGERIGELLDEQGQQIRPLVKVHAGTPIGLFFASSVYDTSNQAQNGFGYPGMNGMVGLNGMNGMNGSMYGNMMQNPYMAGTQLGSGMGGGVPITQFGQYGQNYGQTGQNYAQPGYNTGFNMGGTGYNNSGYAQMPNQGYTGMQTGTGSPNINNQ